ncbi:MAG: cell division protein FtsZ [Bacteroidales bacterium]|nr:cell division protein FtsZ [Candidatus Cryptobacteroides faecihippi]MCQ2161738.1 cell division protein FtsZ [Bacteroidales bacterium]
MTEEFDNINIEPTDWAPIESMIKVIGVGGAGCNAVNYMFNEKIEGCSFIVCNTDMQVLEASPVPVKIHIGRNSLGAGTDPEKGRKAAVEAKDEIDKVVMTEATKMLFITAGMGGGTGTGAAPVIAEMAKSKGILTVAVVTIPAEADGVVTLAKAIDGIHELVKNVDSLLIINNEKLFDQFGTHLIHDAYPKADEVLATAVKGITEIISRKGYINVDFEDIETMMKNSGMALMGCGKGSGENRIEDAVKGALESPLLNDFDLKTAKNLLVNITCGKNEKGLTMDDLASINKLIGEYTGNANKFKTGIVYDTNPEVGDHIQITAIATGFKINDLTRIAKKDLGNLIIIDKNFKFVSSPVLEPEEAIIQINGGTKVTTIGPSQELNKIPRIDRKPVLFVDPTQNTAELENEPAIRRAEKMKKA